MAGRARYGNAAGSHSHAEFAVFCMDVVSEGEAPMTSSQCERGMSNLTGGMRGRKYINDMVKRVGNCLHKTDVRAKDTDDRADFVWDC